MNYREKTKNELINELEVLKQEFEASKTSLNREIAEREKTAFSLMERMKELRCHNEIATILSNANLALDDVLEKIIQIIPDSMQFPEIAGVSIKINDKVFKTQNFVKSKHTLSQQISLHFKIVGHLEVSYAEALLPPAKQIFLPEETELLFSVAQRIGGVIEKMEREHTLAQNHATLQKIIESINDVIYEISAENVITFVSPSIEKLVGYKPDELIGKNFTSFIYEPDLLFVLETFALLPGIVLPYIEYRIVAKNGSLCWIRSSTSVIFENGKMVGVTGSITNITQQKQIETELQTSESLYRSILNASPDVITITDLEGKVLFASPKALEMFGYDHIETFKGRSILEYVIPECHEKAIYGISQMLLGNLMGAEEYIALRQDGSTFDVEINGEFVRDEHGIPQKMIFITRDISDRKMAEEKLRHSEEQFRHLVESIKDVIYEIGANGTVNYVSPSVNQIIGYEQDEVIGHSFLEFVHPDDKAALMNAFKNLESRKYPYFEYRYIAKNGNIHWVRSSTTAIIKDGKMIGGNGSMTDITEWKKANDALAESEEKYRLMFFDNPQPMVIYDIETLAFLEVNEAAIKQYGYSRAEFLQFSIKDLHSPEDIASVIEDVELSKNNQNSLTEWKHFGKNKTQFFVELTSHSVIFKGRKARHVLINDITARKHAEDAVQESSQKLEAIISASPDGIGMISFDGKLKLVSAKLALMYGYSVEEKDAFIGKSVIDFIDPSYHKIMKENIQKLLSGSVNHHITEYLAIRKDNSRFYSESNSTVLFDPNGKPTDILYTQRDITDRKEAENELIQREGLLNSIIETARDSIFIKDASLTYIKVNKAMASLFGRPKEEIVGKSDAELFGAASGDHIEEIDRQVLLGQTVEEFPSKPVNGEIKHFHTIKVPLKDVNGQTYGLCGIARDITESKQAEKALQSSEERFRAISEYSSSSICILNTAGKVIWVNDAMLKMMGYTSEQVYSTESFTAFLAPECAEFVITNFMKFVNHGDYEHHYQFSIIRADGEKRLCEKFMSHYEDQSGKLNLIISMMDITERHYAEQSLRTNRQELINSNNQLEMAQRIGHSGSWLYDIETQKIWGSGEAKRLFGFEKDEEFFTLENIEACIPDRERIHQALIDLIVNGTPYDVEYVLQPADGSNPRAILSKARIEKDETGKVISIIGVVQDITDRVSAEQNLVESEEKFRAIAEQTSDFISISNSNGQITYASPASALVFDIAPEDMLGRNFIGFVDESDIERAIQTFGDCLENDNNLKNAEFCLKRADGTMFTAELNASKFHTGTQFGTLVTIRDITERKLANEALMASEEKYRLLFYNNPQPMWIYDIETLAFLEVNQAAITHYGYSRDEFLSMTLRDIRPAEDIADLLKDVELSKNNQNSQIEWRHLRKNKELRIVEITAQSLIFNGRSARHVLIIDITERKKAEEELRKFRTISDQANYGAAVSALDGSFIYVNNAFALMHGYETHELIGKDHKIVHNEEQLARVDEIMALISANRGFVSEEIYHTRKDGTTFPTLMSAAVIYNEKNIPQFLSTTTIDITESKLAEQEIHDLNENLETKIIIRTIQLEETNEILQNEIQSRMLVEVELALEKHRLSEIIEGTNVGTWEWNIQTGQAIFNERWAEIIGYTLDELAPVSIDTWMKFAHPDDIILSGQLMEKHFKGELAYYSFESRMKHKNGEWVWVLDRGKVHDWDMDHKPLMMSGTHQDITESKRASEFETELLQLSLQLTGIPVSEIVPALNMALQRIGGFLGADRAYIFEISDTEKTMSNTFEWCNTGINPEIENLKDVPLEILPKWMEIIQKHENIIIPSVKDLAEDWVAEREILEPQGIQSLVVIPMFIGNMLIGFVGLDSVLNKREYKDSEINILKVWGNMLASLLNHQRKEEFIEQTRRNYETFFNTIDDFLFVLDQQGNIIHTNTTVTRRLGYDTKELLEKSILMVHPAERRDEAGYTVGEMLAGTTEFCPVPLVTKSGEYIPVETRVKHGLWDGRPAIFGVTKDVSKIKLSEEKFSKAFQSNSALMAISNLDGRFLEVNNMFLKTLGFTREEIIGYNTHNLQIYENVELRDEMVERLKQNIPVKEVEMKVRTKSGEMRIGLYSADTIYIGKDLCLLTMMVDITERKQAEEKINQARDEAEKANRAKSEFLSRMSHELRTPMNSILGFAQLMEMGELNISQKKGVKHILNSGKHLLNLINEVLDISRIEAGRISLSMEPIHIGGVIMEMLDAMQPNAAKMNIKTGLQNSSADKLFVVADYQRLKQVLLNLLANAFKYNIKGGSVNVQTELMERPEPEITTIRISISDTGVGISAEDLPKLFQPFERIGAEKGETEGTGLGLTVVKKLMEAMGGAIGVTSQVGQGSTFWIELPLAKSQKSLAEQTEWATKLEKGITKTAGTILYIEDNVSNIELVEQILTTQRPGNRLIANMSGNMAVSLAIEYMPDLILLDLDLPDIHGSEVLKNLQAEAKTKYIPVIIISADAMSDRIEKLTLAGVKDYLTKPLDIITFLKAVDTWIK
jgi:PAS domain S-box-containing protein